MGCGISKNGLADDVDTYSFNPHTRKLENLPRNNHAVIADGTSCIEKGCEGYVDDPTDGRKSISSPRKSLEIMKIVAHGREKEGKADQKRVKTKNEELGVVESGGNRENEECQEDEATISDFNGSLRIGSPSFRGYCIIDSDSEDGLKNHGDTQDGGNKDTNIKVCQSNASPMPNEVCVSMTKSSKKREKSGRRFRKVFPSAMKNLFHVKTGNNPDVSASRGVHAN